MIMNVIYSDETFIMTNYDMLYSGPERDYYLAGFDRHVLH